MNKRISRIAFAIGMALAFVTFGSRAQTAAVGPYYAVPSWDQSLPASSRFIVLTNFANQAVLDRETGLVWQRTPLPADTFVNAYTGCIQLSINGRSGWRLPTIAELRSLFDALNGTASQLLPAGHPFVLPPTQALFWSSTAGGKFSIGNFRFVFGYSTVSGIYAGDFGDLLESESFVPWCVRGPGEMGVFQQ